MTIRQLLERYVISRGGPVSSLFLRLSLNSEILASDSYLVDLQLSDHSTLQVSIIEVDEDRIPEDVSPSDIDLVLSQASCTRGQASYALQEFRNDVAAAVRALNEWTTIRIVLMSGEVAAELRFYTIQNPTIGQMLDAFVRMQRGELHPIFLRLLLNGEALPVDRRLQDLALPEDKTLQLVRITVDEDRVDDEVNPRDIDLVLSQVQCTRGQASYALKALNNDIVEAIMALMTPDS